MKTKPVFPLLVSMALPNVISMLVNSLYNIVDSLFVAQINEQAMTALSLVFPIQNFVNAVAIGFGIGINALVALYRGAGDHDRADTAATHGMALSVLHGILCTLAATAIMPRLPGPVHRRRHPRLHGRDLLHHRFPVRYREHGQPRL